MKSNAAPRRVAFETLGCRSNYADTVDLQAALVEQGVEPVAFGAKADVYVLNTCTVTDSADKEVFKLLRRVKRESPEARVVVTGCMAETERAEALTESGLADVVVGPGRKQHVLSAIVSGKVVELKCANDAEPDIVSLPTRRKRNIPQRKTISLLDPISPALSGPADALGNIDNRSRYHLRVQEGCENTCTFCIIPYTRGQYSSRPVQKILDDLAHLERVGYREVVLTGTHLGGYGVDCGSSLYELLEIVEQESPIRRVRLSSIDPNDVDYKLVDLLSKQHIFCSHLHICVQAFCDTTLKRMNRKYRLSQVHDIVGYLSEKIPGICLGSDVITGFPGERRAEVDEAIDVFLSLPFSYLHVFPYSERTGTAATRLPGSVEPAERKRRSARWRALSQQRKRQFAEARIGQEVEVLLETVDTCDATTATYHGTTREYVAASVVLPIENPNTNARAHVGRVVRATGVAYSNREGRLSCELSSLEN